MTSPEPMRRSVSESVSESEPTGESSTTCTGPVARLFLLLIAGYRRFVSPLLGPRCRFYPSCSQYAATAIRVHGAGRGLLLAVRRLLRCHPWNPGGIDHVPPPSAFKGSRRKASKASPTGVTECHIH